MSSYDPPTDLVQLQRDFLAADARCGEIAAMLPLAVDVIAGRAELDLVELTTARADRGRLLDKLIEHDWWNRVENRAAAKQALRAQAAEYQPR